MQIIMGGSSTSGASLLSNILNHHQDIFSGGQSNLLAKKLVYESWKKAKLRLFKSKSGSLRNHGWHISNGTNLLHKEYLWEKPALEKLVKESSSLNDFTASFYSKALELKGANIWLEKTPSNSACFSFFLNSFAEGKVIHIVRNPFDTIASFIDRGMDIYYAVGLYMLNTACGINTIDSKRSFTVKYEDLVHNSGDVIQQICRFLEIRFTDYMLDPQREVSDKNSGVGRFNKSTDEMQDTILEAVNMMQINGTGRNYYNTKIQNIGEICDVLGYDFYEISKTTTYTKLKSLQKKERLKRAWKGNPTGFYYPIEIRR